MKEKQEKAYRTIVEHGSPHIRLGYVIDDEGNLMANFSFHPQISECYLNLDVVSSNSKEVILSTEEVRAFADRLYQFVDTAETIIDDYNETYNK